MKRKIKKRPVFIAVAIIVIIIILICFIVKTINYHKTYDYKLSKLGYKKEEITEIQKLDNSTIDYLLTIKYNDDLIDLLNEKYFMEKNIKKYLKYIENTDRSLTDVVAIVNVGADKEFYTDTKKTNTDKGILMLTNKFYQLDDTYTENDMKKISSIYSYGENQMLLEEAYYAFIKMFKDAKLEDLTLIINSSFRSYEEQKEIYEQYESSKGLEYADTIAARAGFSEHQTGLAVDIQTYNSNAATFEEFDEFKWLQENAYKYGFILRYPKGKEFLTGYEYESWHYRYVGVEVATYIHENNITFDEYYAFFIEE